MLIVEWAEFLLEQGAKVTIFAHDVDGGPAKHIKRIGGITTDAADSLELTGFDVVYSNHQALSHLLAEADFEVSDRLPVFVYAHLSPLEPMELPLSTVEPHLVDLVLANSVETAERLKEFGPAFLSPVVFPNPAPESFFAVKKTPAPKLRRLLAISNHADPTVSKALELVASQGVHVTLVGKERKNSRRVVPSDFENHDAVFTIGKSAQYAIATRTPVYCFDRFGGPGWLRAENIEAAGRQNFSGRSHSETKTPQLVAKELISGFQAAQEFSFALAHDSIDRYRSKLHMEAVLSRVESCREDLDRFARKLSYLLSDEGRRAVEIEGLLQSVYRREMRHRVGVEKNSAVIHARYLAIQSTLAPLFAIFRGGRSAARLVRSLVGRA